MQEQLTDSDVDTIPMTLVVTEIETHTRRRCPATTRQIRDLAMDRKIPAFRHGSRWLIRRADLAAVAAVLDRIYAPVGAGDSL